MQNRTIVVSPQVTVVTVLRAVLGRQLTLLVFTGRGGAGELLQVTGVFTDGVVVGVVDDPQLSHDVTPDGGLDSPVVDVTLLLVAGQLLHINDLGAQPVQDDPDVLDAEVVFLVDGELVDQEEKLATGGSVALLALNFSIKSTALDQYYTK